MIRSIARGILHSVASKNNFDDAYGVLEKFGLHEYFLYPQIGWGPKSHSISQISTAEGDHDLARRAIDRAVLDAQTVDPANKDQLASLKIFKARIALAQGDLLTAEASAASANRIFYTSRLRVLDRIKPTNIETISICISLPSIATT